MRMGRRWLWLLALAFWVGLPALASATMVDSCDDPDYVDRTAPNADRTLIWNFPISGAPERCMKIRAGQSVRWNGDFSIHPLENDEGATPNPINFHDEAGAVVFTQPGVYGYRCNYHYEMRGAIQVLAAAPAAAPAVPWSGAAARVALAGALLLVGRQVVRRRLRRSRA